MNKSNKELSITDHQLVEVYSQGQWTTVWKKKNHITQAGKKVKTKIGKK